MVRPTPVPDELSEPFWNACNEGRLVVQNCKACNRMQYPPERVCSERGSKSDMEWREVSGRGTINGYVVVHDSRLRVWVPQQPYNVAVIEIEEDPAINFFSNLPGTPVDQVPVGASVQVEFLETETGQKIPEWRIVGD